MPEKTWLQKTPLQSKKFLAAMIWNFFWLCLIGYGISMQLTPDVLSAMVYTSGVCQALYLGGQSAVDAIVRAAFAKNKNQGS